MRPTVILFRVFLRILCATCGALTCFVAMSFAQSSSKQEEDLRASLLKRMSQGLAVTIAELKPYYVRPRVIPFRDQPKTFALDRDAAIALGKQLFFDTRLSKSGNIACASCHQPKRSWVDGVAQSIEGNSRKSMSIFNLAWDSCFTWHCKSGSLMSQAIIAMTAPKGMGSNLFEIAKRVEQIPGYVPLFKKAYPKLKNLIHPDSVALALEYYVSSQQSAEARFDKWIQGDENAISDAAKRGFLKFHTQAPCAQCHNLWRFSDSRMYDIGLADSPDGNQRFKSVGLRNIAERSPYMHDGSIGTLEDVLEFYMRGGDTARDTKASVIRPFSLSLEDQADILLFLQTLSAPVAETAPPPVH